VEGKRWDAMHVVTKTGLALRPTSQRAVGEAGKGGAEEPPDHGLGLSRHRFGTRLHMATDSNGLPLAVEVTAAQQHKFAQFEKLMNAVRIPQPRGRPRRRQAVVAGDKGYSYPRIR